MLFNSTEFLVFFVLFCAGYYLVRNSLRARNGLVLISSYIFYGWWDYRFTALLFFTSFVDFIIARAISGAATEGRRRMLLTTSIVLNLGVLCTFKYFNFFCASFESLANAFGADMHWKGWNVVLPVGVSFYTFQSMGYVVDVFRRQMPASRDLVQFLAYVSFFPQLVAGPIERGTHLLPQFARTLQITAADVQSGLWLAMWGMFKKVVIADNLAPMVELVYGHGTPAGPAVVLGTIAFGIQIYCDFSGYSDIARGVARMIGFELMVNFNLPYFATSLRDFWRRWHISLSSWLRDYLYIPLGGNRRGGARTYLNLGITMLVCGLWHGASLTFVAWGCWHGLGLMANHWWSAGPSKRGLLPAWLGWLATSVFVFYGWMLFRAQSLDQVWQYTRALGDFSPPVWYRPYVFNLIVLAGPLVAMEAWQRRTGRLEPALSLGRWPRAALQGAMVLIIAAFWQDEASPFIYFQF